MKTIRHISAILFCIVCALAPTVSRAQIGYQVSLLNTATGEPRAGVTVSAVVTITDSSDKVVYTGTQQATTNDFGVLSLAVGDDATFKNADWSKLPFFISVSVNGTLVGKSQILSVPVAEYAKKTGELTKDMLVGTWVSAYKQQIEHMDRYSITDSEGHSKNIEYKFISYKNEDRKIQFFEDGTFKSTGNVKEGTIGHRDFNGNPNDYNEEGSNEVTGDYFINGNDVRLILSPSSYPDRDDSYLSDYTEYSTNFFIRAYDVYYIQSKKVLLDNDYIFSQGNCHAYTKQ